MCFWVLSYDFGLLGCCCWWWWFVQCNCLFGRLGCQTCLLLRSLLCHSRSCVDMSSLWVFIRLPYESPRVGTCMMSLVPWQKTSNTVHTLGWNFQGIPIWDQGNYMWISSKSFFKFVKNFRQQDVFAMGAIQMIISSWFLCSCIIDGNCSIFLVIRFLFDQITNLFFYFIWNNSMAKAERREIKSG